MNLTKTNGVWKIDQRLPNGQRLRKSLKTSDLKEAKLRAAELYQQALQLAQSAPEGLATPAPKKSKIRTISLGEAFELAMKKRKKWRESNRPENFRDNYNQIIKRLPASTDLSEINADLMMDLAEKWETEDGIAGGSINRRLSLVSVLLEEAAYNWKIRGVQPFKMPTREEAEGSFRTFSPKEEQAHIEWFRNSKLKYAQEMADLIPCLADSGFRLSEMLNLDGNRGRVDFDNNVILLLKKTKNGKPRAIPMSKRLRAIMEKRYNPPGKPFGTLDRYSAAKAFEALRRALGIWADTDPDAGLHAYRHSAATRLAAKNVAAFKLQQFMGHSRVETTQIYVNLAAKQIEDLSGIMDDIYEENAMPTLKEMTGVEDKETT